MPGSISRGVHAALLAFQLAGGSAAAAPLTADDILDQFNVVTFGSMTARSDVQGRTYVGGSLSGNATFGTRAAPASSFATLTVGGSLSGGVNVNSGNVAVGGSLSGNVNLNNNAGAVSLVAGSLSGNVNVNGGTIRVGGAVNGNFNRNGGATATVGQPVSVNLPTSEFRSTLTALSEQLELLDGNSTVSLVGSRATFNARPDANGVAVFEIDNGTTFFASIGEIGWNVNGARSIIVNVGGTTLDIAENFLAGSAAAYASSILWNFHDATSIKIGAEFGGTILATNAALTNTANIDGTVIVDSFNERGTVLQYLYSGTLPAASSASLAANAAAVDEPDAIALLLTGLLLAGAVRNRRLRRTS